MLSVSAKPPVVAPLVTPAVPPSPPPKIPLPPMTEAVGKVASRIKVWSPPKPNLQFDKLRPAFGGLLGGATSTLLLHPLDLLKTRQAVHANIKTNNNNRYAKIGSAVREAVRAGGGLKGLYAGVGANVATSAASWGVYFTAYGALKSCLADGDSKLTTTTQLISTFGAGAATTIIINPLSVLRTRLVMQDKRTSALTTLKTLLREGGVRSLFTKGLVPSLVGVSHGAAQLILYEHVKDEIKARKEDPTAKLTTAETLFSCCVSKLAAALLTYPCQNVRACQQALTAGAEQVSAMSILRTGGVRALYAGLVPYLAHVVPNVCVVFLVYEAVVADN